jgi:hypothetical protein
MLLGRAQKVILLLNYVCHNFISYVSYVSFYAKRNKSFPKESPSVFRCHLFPLFLHVSPEISDRNARSFSYLERDSMCRHLCSVFAMLILDSFGEQCILHLFKLVTHHLVKGLFHVVSVTKRFVCFQCPPLSDTVFLL